MGMLDDQFPNRGAMAPDQLLGMLSRRGGMPSVLGDPDYGATTSTTNDAGQPMGPNGMPMRTSMPARGLPMAAPPSSPDPTSPPPNIPPTSLAGRFGAGGASPSFGDRALAGIMGLTQARSPVAGIGQMIGGLVTGQRQDPVGIQQASMAQAYQSLVSAGVDPHQAMAAIAAMQAGDPSLMHATAEQFGLPKAQQIGEDPNTATKTFATPGGTAMNPNFQMPQTLSPSQARLARQPEAFQRQMFFRGQGTVYQGADGHILRRGGDGRVIDQMTGQEVRG